MKQLQFGNLIILSVFLTFAGCGKVDEDENNVEIAVTNTYIQSAVQDFLGNDKSVFCLTSPGMCPGHFDMRPSQIRELSKCRLLVRFDFQEGLDKKIAGRTNGLCSEGE